MKVYNIKHEDDFETTIIGVADKLNISVDKNYVSKNCMRIKLNKIKENKNYQRIGYYNNKDGSKRKVNAICWHGFRDFISEIYKFHPHVRVVSSTATYLNKQDFEYKYPNTAYKNIGSQIQPMSYADACLCNE